MLRRGKGNVQTRYEPAIGMPEFLEGVGYVAAVNKDPSRG